MSQSTATTLPRTDWSLIWAQPGFRYFFFAMFISLFGSGMNFAGVRKLAVIFVCENNRYAYSTPLEKQMAIENVADRAEAYGFRGHVVSGNDLLAVVQLSEKVTERVREGGGPALIECKTYRYRGHSEHDPAL